MPRLAPGGNPSPTRPFRLWNGTLEALREHPIFDVPDPHGRRWVSEGSQTASPDASLQESDRSTYFRAETLHLFRRRTQLINATAMVSLVPFGLLYARFVPESAIAVSFMHAMMFLVCAALNWLSRRTESLGLARLWAMLTYLVFGLTASGVMAACKDPRVNAFSGHQQIMMSLLFMPFSAPQAGFCALLTSASYGLGLASGLSAEDLATIYWPQIVSMAFTGVVMTCMAHLQSVTRLRAFNAAFDMALNAQRGAELSNLDAVTGGFNRRHLTNILELELSRAGRFRQPISLLLFDLDNFKPVNDSLGHAAGDLVLREVQVATASTLRNLDTVGRYGGDEFAVVLPGTGPDAALYTANRLRDSIRGHLNNRFGSDSLQAKVTLSLGMACFEGKNIPSLEVALERVDENLYAAKRGGKDRIVGG